MKSLEEIENAVCEVFEITNEFIHQKSRAKKRPIYRLLICYISRSYNARKITFQKLGDYFMLTNSNIQHGIAVVKNEIDTNQEFKRKVKEVLDKLEPRSEKENAKSSLIIEIFNLHFDGKISTEEFNSINNLIEKL